MQNLALIFLTLALGLAGQFTLKIGMNRIGRIDLTSLSAIANSLFRTLTSPFVIFGLGLYFLAALLWLIVLSRTDLMYSYPFLSLSYAAVFLLSWIFLGEELTLPRLVGTLLIMAGFLVMAKWGA